jgi:hypothetical protein
MTHNKQSHHDTGLFSRLKKDLSAVDHFDEISREYKDFRDFYLDPKLQSRLRSMGWFRRWIYFAGWITAKQNRF